jgi:hypothetical protein
MGESFHIDPTPNDFRAHAFTSPVPPHDEHGRCPAEAADPSTAANAANAANAAADRDVTRFQPCPRHETQRLSVLLCTSASPLVNRAAFPDTVDMPRR